MIPLSRIAIASLLSLAVAWPVFARTAQAPGSRIVLDLPDIYKPAPRFAGFIDQPRGISIILTEFPAEAYEQVIQGMTPETLATKGFTNTTVGKLERDDTHVYVTAEQASGGVAYAKFLLILRAPSATALVTVNVPKDHIVRGVASAAEIALVLKTARVADAVAPEKPLFSLSYLGPFKRAGTLSGAATLYTLDGVLAPATPEPDRTVFIVAPSLDKRPIADVEAFSRNALQSLPSSKDVAVTTVRKLKIAGRDATELVAAATHAQTGTPLLIVQTVRVLSGGGYVRMIGLTPASGSDKFLPEFRKMAESYSAAP